MDEMMMREEEKEEFYEGVVDKNGECFWDGGKSVELFAWEIVYLCVYEIIWGVILFLRIE